MVTIVITNSSVIFPSLFFFLPSLHILFFYVLHLVLQLNTHSFKELEFSLGRHIHKQNHGVTLQGSNRLVYGRALITRQAEERCSQSPDSPFQSFIVNEKSRGGTQGV